MNHFLAYGNSDQASFRDEEVQGSMNFMTVPGTIAAYYQDATAAFVLSSGLDYFIDPRTPLFQRDIDEPRASHYSLANQLGASVSQRLESSSGATSFPAAFYSTDVIAEMVEGVLAFQRLYGRRADDITEKLNRYSRLLAAAQNRSQADNLRQTPGRPPSFVVAPYFVSASVGDEWWRVNEEVWAACIQRQVDGMISPVVAVEHVDQLAGALATLTPELSDPVFYWVANLDERRASEEALRQLWAAVDEFQRRPVNLYGGFFSICLHHAGMWGFNNGLGYSEARNWPELAATGAAPARYYVPSLHMFLPVAQAQQLIDADRTFACDCSTCSRATDGIVNLGYHSLKRHFAIARRREIDFVTTRSRADLVAELRDVATRFNTSVRPHLPVKTLATADFLIRWADVIESA